LRENESSITRAARDCETAESFDRKRGGVMAVVGPVRAARESRNETTMQLAAP
jgi:hypothetical protein